jgi:hypothetical protein
LSTKGAISAQRLRGQVASQEGTKSRPTARRLLTKLANRRPQRLTRSSPSVDQRLGLGLGLGLILLRTVHPSHHRVRGGPASEGPGWEFEATVLSASRGRLADAVRDGLHRDCEAVLSQSCGPCADVMRDGRCALDAGWYF